MVKRFVSLHRGSVPLEAQSVLQREGGSEFEVVLHECRHGVGVDAAGDDVRLDAEDGGLSGLEQAGRGCGSGKGERADIAGEAGQPCSGGTRRPT